MRTCSAIAAAPPEVGLLSAFRAHCGSVQIEIHDVDHGPPHCQVSGLPGGGSGTVDLLTLQVRPPGLMLPVAVRRCLCERQQDMLAAWGDVVGWGRGE